VSPWAGTTIRFDWSRMKCDCGVLVQGESQRPTTPSRRRKGSSSSADKNSPCSQPLCALNTRPRTSITQARTPISPTSSKRGLSRRTIANITPNHNPNFKPHSPGKTPEAVPANPSPSAKRSRRSHKSLPSPVSTGALLRDSNESGHHNYPRIHDGCVSKPLDYGSLPSDVDMYGTSPNIAICVNRSAELLNVPEHSPLTGSRGHISPAAARSSRMPQSAARGSTSLMQVPEGSEVGRGPEGAADNVNCSKTDASRNSLRKSLLNIDPMRVSYSTDGLVSLAGECTSLNSCGLRLLTLPQVVSRLQPDSMEDWTWRPVAIHE
jgi:hypothetical protein